MSLYAAEVDVPFVRSVQVHAPEHFQSRNHETFVAFELFAAFVVNPLR
jgi:hypothetical protein